MFVQIIAMTALLLTAAPVEDQRIQDEEAAWAALYEIIPEHSHPRRGRVRLKPVQDLGKMAADLEELLPRIAGTRAEPIAHFHLGNALFRLDRFEDAAKRFETLKKAFPKHGLCRALAKGETSLVDQAIAECRGEIELRKNYEVLDLPKAVLGGDGRAVFHTKEGSFEIRCYEAASPKTVANFKKLVEDGYYVGMSFHEVASYRKLVLGCPNTRNPDKGKETWGLGGPREELPLELNDALHGPGAVSMNRTATGKSHGSQFTICLSDQRELNNRQVVFGKLIRGHDVLRRLSQTRVDPRGRPESRIEITGTEWLALTARPPTRRSR